MAQATVGLGHSTPHSWRVCRIWWSTETLSDEEDPMAGLSLHMSHSLLVGEDKLSTAFWKENPKTTKPVAGSPQLTLCEVGSWSGCSNGSSRASSNGPSQVSSPPTTPMDQKDDAWDLLYAAAGQVMRMKMNEQGLESHGQGLLGQPRKSVPVPVSTHMKTPNSGYYSDDTFAHRRMSWKFWPAVCNQKKAARNWNQLPAMQQKRLDVQLQLVGWQFFLTVTIRI